MLLDAMNRIHKVGFILLGLVTLVQVSLDVGEGS